MSGQKSNKNRKYGRNEKDCKAYEARGQQEKNRKMKMLRHMRNHPDDEKTYQRFKSFYGHTIVQSFEWTAKGVKRHANLLMREGQLSQLNT